jgi:hypothetical protein
MKFESFVPAPVRIYIEETISGSQNHDGLEKILANAKQSFLDISASLQQKLDDIGFLDSESIDKKNRTQAYRDQCEGDVAFLCRLGSDLRMKAAYKSLEKVFTTDDQWRQFLYCCWSARIDFNRYREKMENATDLSKKIAEEAESLATKIRAIEQVHTNLPLELHSIQALLRVTENRSLFDRNLEMWRIHRGVVLADQPPQDFDNARLIQETTTLHKVSFRSDEEVVQQKVVSEVDQYRSNVKYSWGLAPDFASLLFKLAEIMKDFLPKEHGYIGAGLASRESNEKTAYIRALYNLLSNSPGIEMNLHVRKAIVSVTSIALDQKDVEVTLDDVTKAIGSFEAKNAR